MGGRWQVRRLLRWAARASDVLPAAARPQRRQALQGGHRELRLRPRGVAGERRGHQGLCGGRRDPRQERRVETARGLPEGEPRPAHLIVRRGGVWLLPWLNNQGRFVSLGTVFVESGNRNTRARCVIPYQG